MSSLTRYLFRLFCVKQVIESNDRAKIFQEDFESTALYFQRFNNQIDLKDKTVLDVGCGIGATCLYVAQHGARQVVGIDIQPEYITCAQEELANEHSHLADRVTFKLISTAKDLGEQKFDIILSKDSFEHIANPKQYLQDLQDHVTDDGIIVIGFGPLWKSPWGGHITFMTKLPWAHLLFPERVIMQERMRLINPRDKAETFEQWAIGMNKMTLQKFNEIMKESNLEAVYFQTNVHTRLLAKVFNVLRHIPGCKEYFTFNLYSIWRLKAPNEDARNVE